MWSGYFLLRRWTRVFFSSLRCFFLAIRLRRFLMTEPMCSQTSIDAGRRTDGPAYRPPSRNHECAGTQPPKMTTGGGSSRRAPTGEEASVRPADRASEASLRFDRETAPSAASGSDRERSTAVLPSFDERRPQVVVHGLLGDAEGSPDADGRKITAVDHP